MAISVAFSTPASSSTGAQDKLQAVREAVNSVSKEINALSPSIPGANTSIQEKLQGLREAVDSLGTEINSIFSHRPQTWTSVPITEIGNSTLLSMDTSAFDIPDVIPSTAKNVLVYAPFYTGTSNNGRSQHLKIFTQDGSDNSYEKYLFMHTYPMNGVNTNSENMWFPMPANWMVHMSLFEAAPGSNCEAHLYVTGYNWGH